MIPPFSLKDAPAEVVNVWAIKQIGNPVGSELMKKINEVVERYPEYFPWEHKYKSIPEHVHEAFWQEKLDYLKSLEQQKWDREERESSYGYIKPPEDIKLDDVFKRLFEQQEKMKKERRERYIAVKAIWDKHYKQYELEFQEKHLI